MAEKSIVIRVDGKARRVKKSAPSSTKKYLIWNRCFVGNSLVFWREGKAGYTTDIDKAHKFTYEEAVKTIGSSDHGLISWEYLQMISTRQIHADHLDWDYVGKEVMDA